MTSYNRPTLVRLAIQSVLKQTVQDFEFIIADDGSNEETREAIRTCIGVDPRVRVLVASRPPGLVTGGFVNRAINGINEALKVSSGAIVHYLCDDDLFDVERFSIFDELFKDQRVVVGYGRLHYINLNGSLTGATRFFNSVPDPFGVLDMNQCVHRRETMEKVPGWRTVASDCYEGDAHFFRDLSKAWPFCGIDKVVAYKRVHGHNLQHTKHQTTGARE
jgi:spore maturation protein CgeD